MSDPLAHPDFQPYWVAYALAHGRTPADQLADDRSSTGRFLGHRFMAWIEAEHRAFDPSAKVRSTPAYVAEFTAWLAARHAGKAAA